MRVVLIANLMDPYNRRIMPGVADFARLRRWDLVIHNPSNPATLPDAIAGADGLLLGIHNHEHDPVLTRTQLPAVCWSGSLTEVNWRRVMNDDFAVGQVVAQHLMERGFRHFVFFNDSPDIWAVRRREGFLGRLEAAGLSAEILSMPWNQNAIDVDVVRRLARLPRPMGAMLSHDQSALRFMTACHEAGLTIPADVAVVGVNNDPFIIDVTDPPLSSVKLQTDRIGYESAALLAKLLDKQPMPPWSIVVPPGDIVVRQSSDTLATTDQLVIDAVHLIRSRLASGIGTKEVAAAVGVSRTTLDVRFTAAIGRSASAEIRRQRLDVVRQLLSSTDLPMPEVARRSGFSSAQQLSESFTRFVGQTPTAFRKHFVVHSSR
jgi:LacI family transcriptional regulator